MEWTLTAPSSQQNLRSLNLQKSAIFLSCFKKIRALKIPKNLSYQGIGLQHWRCEVRLKLFFSSHLQRGDNGEVEDLNQQMELY